MNAPYFVGCASPSVAAASVEYDARKNPSWGVYDLNAGILQHSLELG
jgi:hypothetical protein